MAAQHNFRKLNIWKKGIDLVKQTYLATIVFPKSEVYALSSQLQRCSVSIPSNIAEGTGRKSQKHFLQYLETALGSAFEWKTQLIIAYEVKYISKETFEHLEQKIQSIQGMITRFMESLEYKS
ncbi:four helix bundle protein [uncultured Croceitalea sp.]|uniref:four helix bundle protein n=1 Tax=uncultured Croceitalea sp. TaxID=1798908 RepID=UPI003305A80A